MIGAKLLPINSENSQNVLPRKLSHFETNCFTGYTYELSHVVDCTGICIEKSSTSSCKIADNSLAVPRDRTSSRNVMVLFQTYGISRSHLTH